MKYQLVVLAAFIALFGSTRSAPQNAVAVEEGAGEAVEVAERKGADESQGDYQNDYVYRYGMGYTRNSMAYQAMLNNMKGSYLAPTGSYLAPTTKQTYDQKVLELTQCQAERDALLAAANPYLLREAPPALVEAKDDVAPICSVKPDSGPCRSYVQRYYYDEDTESCRKFTYGGCGGNSNNFGSAYECERNCKASCTKPVDAGYCSGRITRYYFNPAAGKCVPFLYGGCGGNSNNYLTLQQCQATCDETCTMPMDKGDCYSAVARWYHNSESNQCEVFIYTGCGGNANNFMTKDACESHC